MGRAALLSLMVMAGVLEQANATVEIPVDLELALGIDVSRSIDAAEAQLQRDGYIAAFRDPDVIRAIGSGFHGRIAVGYYEWAGIDRARVVVGWTLIDGTESAHAFSDALRRTAPKSARRTSISGAIDFAQPWFDRNGFAGARRVIDISGDGPNNWGDLVTTARDKAVSAGITINGLPILDEGGGLYTRYNIPNLDLYYRDCVIGGPGAFIVVAADFKDFGRAIRRKLILEIAGRTPLETARLMHAQARQNKRISPPCDIGEQILRSRDDF